jgi:hypothetical protein
MPQSPFVQLRILLVTIAAMFTSSSVADDVSAQQPGQQSLADSIIDAVQKQQSLIKLAQQEEASIQSQIEEAESKLLSAEDTLASMQGDKPILQNAWKDLQIGEFESQKIFKRRQNEAKTREKREFEKAERDWREQFSKYEASVNLWRPATAQKVKELREAIRTAKERTASCEWHIPELPLLSLELTSKELVLPRFNRESMSFDPVIFQERPAIEMSGSQTGLLVAKIEVSNWSDIAIKLSSLEEAKQFKERFEAGDITCHVVGGLDLTQSESPIILQEEISKEEETYVTPKNTFITAVGLAILLFGSPPDQTADPNFIAGNNAFELKSEKSKVIVQPEKKMSGTRYHFNMSQEIVVFLDKERGIVKEASVVFSKDFVRVKEVIADSQLDGILQPGDKIVRVGDREIRSATALRSAVRSYKADQTFDVTYRRAESEEDLHLTAQGGKPLGVRAE